MKGMTTFLPTYLEGDPTPTYLGRDGHLSTFTGAVYPPIHLITYLGGDSHPPFQEEVATSPSLWSSLSTYLPRQRIYQFWSSLSTYLLIYLGEERYPPTCLGGDGHLPTNPPFF